MTRTISALLGFMLLLGAGSAAATAKLERKVEAATSVLEQLTEIPEQGIPHQLLNNAYAVAVIPNIIKAGFIIGGRYGEGVLVMRRPDGQWSNPSFVTMGGGSVGFQAGAQSSDLVLVFKTKRSVESITNGKITLGGDVSVAAGPWGRYTSAATDMQLKAEIFAYARNRGLFGGIALDGSVLGIDKKANFAYYGTGDATARDIFANDSIPTPVQARRFKEVLAATAPALQWQPGVGSRTAAIAPAQPAPAPAPATDSGAQTFGLEDAPAAQSDVVF